MLRIEELEKVFQMLFAGRLSFVVSRIAECYRMFLFVMRTIASRRNPDPQAVPGL